jgi:hypothetical protein
VVAQAQAPVVHRAAAGAAQEPPVAYERNIFLNCPFDTEYSPLFQAITFAVHECGFQARCALEAEDSGEVRIQKIKRIIRECRFGIHDISRVELDAVNQLPRFNMPLELGLFMGAQEYGRGDQKRKLSLVLNAEPYRYQKFCSDIAGQDIRAHFNTAEQAIVAVRGMLSTCLGGDAPIPGASAIQARHVQFLRRLPGLCRELRMRPDELRFVEFRWLVTRWRANNPARGLTAATRRRSGR